MNNIKIDSTFDPLLCSTYKSSQVLSAFNTSIETGLLQKNVNLLYSRFGYNELSKPKPESLLSKIKEQFSDILVIILLIAAIISLITNYFADSTETEDLPPYIEPMVILVILILNSIVGIYQDYNAEKSLEALADLQETKALVLRDLNWIIINSRELLPGDIIKLHTGDKIPADARIIQIHSKMLQINESILTGESNPVSKSDGEINLKEKNERKSIEKFEISLKINNNNKYQELKDLNEKDNNKPASLFDYENILFSGCLVVNGTCLACVVATGPSTQLGQLQKQIHKAGEEEASTPLREKLSEFGEFLAKSITILCVIIWIVNFNHFFDPSFSTPFQGAIHYFKIAVSLAVAAIPEGLPAVITTCLALGTKKMSKNKAIVRKLTSVETLGCTNVICTDKTGTLTTNQMCVTDFFLFSGQKNEKSESQLEFRVSGNDFSVEGEVRCDNLFDDGLQKIKNLQILCECLAVCNESKLISESNKGKPCVKVAGLPTEGALRVLVEKIGRNLVGFQNNDIQYFNEKHVEKYKKIMSHEFTHEKKTMTVLCSEQRNENLISFTKGAPEILLEKSQFLHIDNEVVDLTKDMKNKILNKINIYCEKGLRCLALCYKKDVNLFDEQEKLESELIFIGVVGMMDPPRLDIKKSINLCKKAGVKIIMATGDIRETAKNIAINLEMVDPSIADRNCISGVELESMEPMEHKSLFSNFLSGKDSLIFYRLEPKHKRLLITLLSSFNQVVAMTGDGVNDAPALKQADIGIAMGLSGTEVAKEAADLVLADDNFDSIVKAIEQGRSIYDNMKAFIRYMISSNIGEVVCIFLGSVSGVPDVFSSVQLLWVNLVTDGLPAMALSFNEPDQDIMIKPPRNKNEPLVDKWVFLRYLIIGTYVGLATIGIFIYWFIAYDWTDYPHTLISYQQLTNWTKCSEWKDFEVLNPENFDLGKNNCAYFSIGKKKASSLSLSVLVIIEMFNSLNALSENNSLLDTGLFANVWLLLAIFGSVSMHVLILYVPGLKLIFATTELSFNDWMLVIGFSWPVLLIDEVIKFVVRLFKKNRGELNCWKTE